MDWKRITHQFSQRISTVKKKEINLGHCVSEPLQPTELLNSSTDASSSRWMEESTSHIWNVSAG